MFGIKLGLEQERELLRRLGNPHQGLRYIHVAGTNGKGSVCAMVSAGLSAAGYRTGFYSSPHLVSLRERFRIDGRAVSEKRLEKLLLRLREEVESMRRQGGQPTYFEVMTAVAALYFAAEKLDFVVWETGMGGRFDASNVVVPELSVITAINLDHVQYLGDTEESVAFEKCGIIKSGIPVLAARMKPLIRDIVEKAAEEKKSDLLHTEPHPKMHMPAFCRENADLAYTALTYLGSKYSFEAKPCMEKALENLRWPGRLQELPDGGVVDGAHNPAGAEYLKNYLGKNFPDRKFRVVFACLEGKDPRGMFRALEEIAAEYTFVNLQNSRKTYTPQDLGEILRQVSSRKFSTADSVAEIRETETGLLYTGSLYLAGEVLEKYFGEKGTLDIY